MSRPCNEDESGRYFDIFYWEGWVAGHLVRRILDEILGPAWRGYAVAIMGLIIVGVIVYHGKWSELPIGIVFVVAGALWVWRLRDIDHPIE